MSEMQVQYITHSGTEVIYCSLDPDPFTIKLIDTKVGKKK